MVDVVRRTAEQVFMPLTVGGGIRSIEESRALLNAGSDKVSINSAACKNPQFVADAAKRFGSQCIVVNIDPKRVGGSGFRVQGGGDSGQGAGDAGQVAIQNPKSKIQSLFTEPQTLNPEPY